MRHNGQTRAVTTAPPAIDRRDSCRYSLLDGDARVGWLLHEPAPAPARSIPRNDPFAACPNPIAKTSAHALDPLAGSMNAVLRGRCVGLDRFYDGSQGSASERPAAAKHPARFGLDRFRGGAQGDRGASDSHGSRSEFDGVQFAQLSPSVRAALEAARAVSPPPEAIDDKPTRVLLLDLSHSGFSALCDASLNLGDRCRLHMENQSSQDWIEVTLVSTRRTMHGPHFARFSFTASCPYDLFKRAVIDVERPPRATA